MHFSRGLNGETPDGGKSALVPSFTPQRQLQHQLSVERMNAGSLGSLGKSFASLSPARPGDNTLDSVRLQQSQRTRLDSADLTELHFGGSGDGTGRQISKERSSTTSRGSDSFDLHELEEDMPFAWADGDTMTNASLLVAPAVDSVGAQLLHGLSIHSSHHPSAQGPGGQGYGYDSYQYGDPSRNGGGGSGGAGGGRPSMSNSTYTAQGLSGELLDKINDYKNLSSTFSSK